MARRFRNGPAHYLSNLKALCGDRWSLDANQIALARELGIINKLPAISEDEIDDLNKGDLVVKILAVSQISWLCIQLSTRLARNIPTTQLEVVTLAFTVCSILTYGLLYSRPKDVKTVQEVQAARYPTPAEMIRIANLGPSVFGFWRSDPAMPNHAIHFTNGPYLQLSINVVLIIFGSLHFVAWNYEFPTQFEKTLWRASTIVTVAMVPLATCPAVLTYMLRKTCWPHRKGRILPVLDQFRQRPRLFALGNLVGVIAIVAFMAARAFILVEVVRSLAYQPPDVYRSTWATKVPHVA